MIPTSRRFEFFFLSALPTLITTVLLLVFLSSKHLTGLGQFMPVLPLIPVFYWGLNHSRDMPYWFVFLLGLIMDAVTLPVIGLSSLLYMIFLKLIHMQRRYIHKEGFIIKWAYFAVLLGVIDILCGALLPFLGAGSISIEPAFLQWLFTVCCYPMLHKMFDIISDYIHSRRWQILHGT